MVKPVKHTRPAIALVPEFNRIVAWQRLWPDLHKNLYRTEFNIVNSICYICSRLDSIYTIISKGSFSTSFKQWALAQAMEQQMEDLDFADFCQEWDDILHTMATKTKERDIEQDQQLNYVRTKSATSTGLVGSAESGPSERAEDHNTLVGPTLWWARLLKEHTNTFTVRPRPESGHTRATAVTLVSGCSGICAEAEVLKATWMQCTRVRGSIDRSW